MLSRREFLASGLALAPISGAPSGGDGLEATLYAPAKESVDRGLAFLAACQNKDGSFGTGTGQGHVAITSLAASAFLCGGHQPGQGRYGSIVENAVRYVMKQADAGGLLNHPAAAPRSPMYSHGFATLLIAETHGSVNEPKFAATLAQALRRAVRLILETQNAQGGWRYEVVQVEQADLSVTVAQAAALRAAHNAGIDVPKAAIERCGTFIRRCQALPEGAFRYFPAGGAVSFPLTAAGLVGLHCCAIFDSPAVDAARKYLAGIPFAKRSQPLGNPDYYLYGHYYAVQAMRLAGGKIWSDWYAGIRDELCQKRESDSPLRPQQADGGWPDTKYGSHYATALACIILQQPKNYNLLFPG